MAIRILVLASLIAALPAAAGAQTRDVDPRWAPYLGCWRLSLENTNPGVFDLLAAAARQAPENQLRDDVMICVTPSGEPQAVAQQTVLNGDTVLDEVVSADGAERASAEANCTSTRRAEWSSSGRQLFSRGTVRCTGQPDRRISGLSMMLTGPTWVDVQMVEVNDRRSVRVRRYRLSADQMRAGGRAPRPSGSPAPMERWTLDEVTEAAGKTAPEILQAAIIETGTKLPLNARRLLELEKAGVPDPVVDVMLAMSFPEKFVIDQPSYASAWSGGGGTWGVTPYDPWSVSSGLGWLSLYSPFGYQYYGYYDPRFTPGYGWVVVGAPIVDGSGAPDDADGRVVNGAGYTRVRPRQPEPARVSSSGTVDRTGDSSNSGSGGSSGGGVTSGGYSSGGSGGSSGTGSGSSGGRTAQPRPPGIN